MGMAKQLTFDALDNERSEPDEIPLDPQDMQLVLDGMSWEDWGADR